MKKLLKKITRMKDILLEEENSWMWSLFAIFALLFTAFILLYYIYFST